MDKKCALFWNKAWSGKNFKIKLIEVDSEKSAVAKERLKSHRKKRRERDTPKRKPYKII